MLDTPQNWCDRFAKLAPSESPCPGFRGSEWQAAHAAAKAFLAERAGEAFVQGWQATDLFGVHDSVGIANPSACGALMLAAAAMSAEEITPDHIRFGRLRYFRVPMQCSVPVYHGQE